MNNKDRPERRETHYESQPNYFDRRELSEMIQKERYNRDIIKYIRAKKVEADFYIPINYHSVYVPILYVACLKPGNPELVKYLLSHDANPNNRPDMHKNKINELVMVADPEYLDILTKHGIRLEDKIPQIQGRLRLANLDRLKALKSKGDYQTRRSQKGHF